MNIDWIDLCKVYAALAVPLLGCLFILFNHMIKLHENRDSIHHSIVRYLSIACISFYTTAVICFMIGESVVSTKEKSCYWIGYPFVIVSFAWGTGTVCNYLLFLTRIILTFKHTPILRPSCYIITIVYILAFIYYICMVLTACMEFLFQFSYTSTWMEKHIHSNLFYDLIEPIELISDVSVSLILSYIFISRLSQIATQMTKTARDEQKRKITIKNTQNKELEMQLIPFIDANASVDDVDVDITCENGTSRIGNLDDADDRLDLWHDKQRELLNVQTKLTLLTCVGVLSTDLCLLYDSIYSQLLTNDIEKLGYAKMYELHIVDIFFYSMDCFIGSLVVHLSFVFSEKLYFVLFGGCHDRMFQTAMKKIVDINLDYAIN